MNRRADAPIRVAIVDDHPIFRFGMRALLEATPDMAVAGESASGEEAIVLADSGAVEVVLMDVNMPGMGGIAATARIRDSQPHLAILMVTMLEDDSVFAAMRAGARGYIVKGADPTDTLRVIRAVAGGGRDLQPWHRRTGDELLRTTGRSGTSSRRPYAPRTHGTGAGGPDLDHAGPDQQRGRRASRAQSQDGAELCV